MIESRALVHAIRTQPDDDMPRLVYADWLEERASSENSNQARADFIRLQCRVARMAPDDPELADVKARIAAYAPYKEPWLHPLIQMGWVGWEELEFSRGFLTGLVVPTQHFDFNEVGRFIWDEPVERVTVGGSPESLLKAFSCPTVALLRKFNIVFHHDGPVEAGAGDAVLEKFAETRPRIPEDLFGPIPLLTLAVSDSGWTDRSANTLATSPVFNPLTYLTIQGSFLTPAGLRRLGEAAFAPQLESLTIQGREWASSESGQGRPVARALGSGRFANLKYLRLKGYPLGNAGLLELTMSPLARQLVTFEVQFDMDLRGKGLAALFDRQRWPRLQDLMLFPVGAGADELAPLMSSDRFATLKTFHLYADGATPDTAARLAANPHAAHVEWLGFTGRNIGDAGVVALIESQPLSNVRRLELSGPDLNEATLLRLANPAVFPRMHTLSITCIRTMSEVAEAALRRRFGDRFSFLLSANAGT